jgi:integrase/recombinase XerD
MDRYAKELEQFLISLKEKGRADGTQTKYVYALKSFFDKVGKDPALVEPDDIRRYQAELYDQKLSPKTINVYGAAIRSYYLETLKTGWPENFLARVKERRKLPVLLSQIEVADLINATLEIKERTLLTTMYSAGLRPIEVVHLRHENIDSSRNLLHIELAKGGKNRFVPLSELLLQILRYYWITTDQNKWHWLFPDDQDHLKPYPKQKINDVIKLSAQRAQIEKPITSRILRHCFATHLLELGVDLRKIQLLLGHAVISSTEIYTHLRSTHVPEIKNPLDAIATNLIWQR